MSGVLIGVCSAYEAIVIDHAAQKITSQKMTHEVGKLELTAWIVQKKGTDRLVYSR